MAYGTSTRHRKEERRGGGAVSATVDKVVGLFRGAFIRELMCDVLLPSAFENGDVRENGDGCSFAT